MVQFTCNVPQGVQSADYLEHHEVVRDGCGMNRGSIVYNHQGNIKGVIVKKNIGRDLRIPMKQVIGGSSHHVRPLDNPEVVAKNYILNYSQLKPGLWSSLMYTPVKQDLVFSVLFVSIIFTALGADFLMTSSGSHMNTLCGILIGAIVGVAFYLNIRNVRKIQGLKQS